MRKKGNPSFFFFLVGGSIAAEFRRSSPLPYSLAWEKREGKHMKTYRKKNEFESASNLIQFFRHERIQSTDLNPVANPCLVWHAQ